MIRKFSLVLGHKERKNREFLNLHCSPENGVDPESILWKTVELEESTFEAAIKKSKIDYKEYDLLGISVT